MANESARCAESATITVSPVDMAIDEVYGTVRYTMKDDSHEPAKWRTRLILEKRMGDWALEDIESGIAPPPYEVIDHTGNLITGVGSSQLWSALTAGTLATPFSSTNAQVVVGAATTGWAASSGATPNDYDLQDVPPGSAPTYTNMATGAITGASAASPCVLSVPSWTVQPTVGQVIMVTQVLGTTGIGISAVGGAITAVTNVTNPTITTTSAHSLTVGQWISISGVVGATGVNGNFQVIAVPTTTSFQVVAAAPGVWSSGGSTFTCGTWEVQAVTLNSVTLLNSTGAGSFSASANSQIFSMAKYRQSATVTANPAVGGAITGVTNVINPVITTTSAHGLSVGQLVQIAGVVGAVGVNGIFAVTATAASNTYAITLAVAPGAYSSGGTTNLLGGVQWVAVFGVNNAIHAWGSFGISTGGAATNKQAAPPPALLNHAVSALGTKGASSTWTCTGLTSIA